MMTPTMAVVAVLILCTSALQIAFAQGRSSNIVYFWLPITYVRFEFQPYDVTSGYLWCRSSSKPPEQALYYIVRDYTEIQKAWKIPLRGSPLVCCILGHDQCAWCHRWKRGSLCGGQSIHLFILLSAWPWISWNTNMERCVFRYLINNKRLSKQPTWLIIKDCQNNQHLEQALGSIDGGRHFDTNSCLQILWIGVLNRGEPTVLTLILKSKQASDKAAALLSVLQGICDALTTFNCLKYCLSFCQAPQTFCPRQPENGFPEAIHTCLAPTCPKFHKGQFTEIQGLSIISFCRLRMYSDWTTQLQSKGRSLASSPLQAPAPGPSGGFPMPGYGCKSLLSSHTVSPWRPPLPIGYISNHRLPIELNDDVMREVDFTPPWVPCRVPSKKRVWAVPWTTNCSSIYLLSELPLLYLAGLIEEKISATSRHLMSNAKLLLWFADCKVLRYHTGYANQTLYFDKVIKDSPNFGECCKSCSADPSCQAWTRVAGTFHICVCSDFPYLSLIDYWIMWLKSTLHEREFVLRHFWLSMIASLWL